MVQWRPLGRRRVWVRVRVRVRSDGGKNRSLEGGKIWPSSNFSLRRTLYILKESTSRTRTRERKRIFSFLAFLGVANLFVFLEALNRDLDYLEACNSPGKLIFDG